MKKIKLYILIFVLLMLGTNIRAQVITFTQSGIKAEQVQVKRDAGYVMMDMNLNLDNIDLSSQEMLILTPEIKAADNTVMQTFAPVVITGSKRGKALNRALDFGSYTFPNPPQQIISKNDTKSIPLTLTMPYNERLHNATLAFNEERIGCACENEYTDRYNVLTPILPPMFHPEYTLSYVVPPVEEVKRRSETHSARLNFKVNRYEILRDFDNNAKVLADIDGVVNELRNDPNLKVEEFHITGYASPEGNYDSNMKLSENRAKSFVAYLSKTYDIAPSTIKTDWKGEDWEGLRKVVADLHLDDKENILDIIDNESNISVRKSKLKQLSGGATYRLLLHQYYPPLRRNEYTISYTARSFSIDEAKEKIKTKPQHLSLNEMFLVANSYPKNSEEFKEVFDIAANIYPNDPIAQLNTAAREIDSGEVDKAIARLQKVDMPEAWNNLGIAYIKKKEYATAEQYFRKAAQAGLSTASQNADQLSKWLSTQ